MWPMNSFSARPPSEMRPTVSGAREHCQHTNSESANSLQWKRLSPLYHQHTAHTNTFYFRLPSVKFRKVGLRLKGDNETRVKRQYANWERQAWVGLLSAADAEVAVASAHHSTLYRLFISTTEQYCLSLRHHCCLCRYISVCSNSCGEYNKQWVKEDAEKAAVGMWYIDALPLGRLSLAPIGPAHSNGYK